jgi:hypothetical protein
MLHVDDLAIHEAQCKVQCQFCGASPENIAFHEIYQCEKNFAALIKCRYCSLQMTKQEYAEGHLAKCAELVRIQQENERLAR